MLVNLIVVKIIDKFSVATAVIVKFFFIFLKNLTYHVKITDILIKASFSSK